MYLLNKNIERIFLNDMHIDYKADIIQGWEKESLNIAKLKKALLQTSPTSPILSFLTKMNLRTLIAARDLGCTVIVSERVYPPNCPLDEECETMRKIFYPKATKVVMQTEYCARKWANDFLPTNKISIIPNPAYTLISEAMTEGIPECFVLAAGRLEEQKNYFSLLTAFARLTKDVSFAHLVIIGEGSQQKSLEKYSSDLSISNRVHFIDVVNNLSPWFKAASCFVLSSRFEGFPNVILESMAAGCPVVAFDCLTGPREIIRHGVDGFLIPEGDITALSMSIEKLLLNPDLRHQQGERAMEVLERFNVDKIMMQWTDLLVGK